MKKNFKKILSFILAISMAIPSVQLPVYATEADGYEVETVADDLTGDTTENKDTVVTEVVGEHITGTITENMVWNGGDVIDGVTISGDVTITVNGEVTVNGTIKLDPNAISNVIFAGAKDAMLIRGEEFTGQMFYTEGVSGNFHNMTFNNITLDGGAVWEGDVDKTLKRGTTNNGVKAEGSVLYLLYTNVVLNESVLQNHEDSTGVKANAVFLRYYSTITFNNSVVRNNYSPSDYYSGGVITVRQGGIVKTYNTEVYGNSGVQGGFFGVSSTGSFGGQVEVYNSKFHNNFADAGALFDMQCNSQKGYLLIDGCEFYKNASNRGLIYEHAFSRPVTIKDSYFHDNECAVWDCHADPILDLSGKIVIEEDPDYGKYLFETPLVLSGPLAEGSSIAMSDASVKKLMASGYIVTGTNGYNVTADDLEKFDLPEGYNVVLADVNNDGIADVVTTKEEVTEITLTLKDSLNAEASETGTVYSNIESLPACPFKHEGLLFAGWKDENGNAVAKQKFTETAILTATWKAETPVVKLSKEVATLTATVTNASDVFTYTYQWYMDNVAIEGATSKYYTMTDVNSHTYKCEVTASKAGVTSATGSASGSSSAPAAAQIGDAKFATLAEAIEAAKDGATVTVLCDQEIADTIVVDKTITLDLNGKTISQSKECTGSYEMINNKGNLTITGSGKISFTDTSEGDPTFGWGSYTIRNEGTLVVENGTIEHLGAQNADSIKHMYCAIFQYSGSTTINGGTISTPTYRSVRLWKGDMTITGGTFDGQVWVQAVDDTANLVVNGGSFEPNGNDGSSVFVENAKYDVEFAVSGGTFNTKIGCSDAAKLAGSIAGGTYTEAAVNATNEALLAEGYVFEKNDNGTYGVVDEKELNKEYVLLIQEQLLAGNDVTLDRDIVVDGSYIISVNAPTNGEGKYMNPGIFCVVGGGKYGDGKATFDLNGHSITYNGHAKYTWNDTEYSSCKVAHGLFFANNGGELTIVDSKETAKVMVYGLASAAYPCSPNSKIMIEGGTWKNEGCAEGCGTNLFLYASHGGELYVNGGSFEQAKDAKGNYYLIVEHGGEVKNDVIDYSKTKIVISGGTFIGQSPDEAVFIDQKQGQKISTTDACAEGFVTEQKADGTFGVKLGVVSVNGKGYETFKEAITAANAIEDGATVKLLQDVTLDESMQVTGKATLDLNGKTITGTDNSTGSFALINVMPGADFTVGGTGTITLTATNNRGWGGYSSVISNQRGKLTVNGGTIEHLGGTDMAYAIDNLTNGKGTYAETIINGGTVKSTYRAIRQFLNGVEADNTLTITGGTIEGTKSAVWMQDPNVNANSGALTIGAYAVVKGNVYLDVTEGSTEWPVEVSIAKAALANGSKVVSENVPVGYAVVEKDGVYGVKVSAVYEVSTKAELDAAVKKAVAGDIIKLVADIDYLGSALVINEAITLDLGGKVLTTDYGWGGLHLKGNCAVKNGTLNHKGTVTAIKAWDVAAIEDLVIDVAFKAKGKTIGGIVIQENASGIGTIKNVTIKGEGLTNGIETYNCGNATEPVIGSMENVTIDAKSRGLWISAPCGTATNCDIKGGVSGIELWIKGTYSASIDLVKCTVEGGTQAIYVHDEFTNDANAVNNGRLEITVDGTTVIEGNPLTQTIARAENVEVDEDITVNAVAKVNDTYCTSFKDAIAAANAAEAGAAVTLLEDVEVSKELTISGNVTVSGAHTITRAAGYAGTFFIVNAGATLTLDDGLVFDGGNNWSYKEGALVLKPGGDTYMTNHVAPEDGGVDATAYMVENFGTLNVNKVTMKNNYSTHGAGAIKARTSSVTTIDGALIEHFASNSSGVAVQIGRSDVTSRNAVVTIKGDTRITDNMAEHNGAIIVMHSRGNTFNFEGGSIDNNYIVRAGTVVMSYSDDAENKNKVNMSGGIITKNEAEGYGPMYIHSRSEFVMSGGEISENISYYPNYVRESNTTTITGGKIVNNILTDPKGTYGTAFFSSQKSPATITGGTFTQDVSTWLSENTGLIYDGETFTAVEKAAGDVAYITSKGGYASLTEALAAAEAGDTIILMKDVNASEIITIDKAITLNGAGFTLTSTAGRAINVSGADGVTIKNLTINASGERAINVIQGAKNVTIDNVTATAANYTVCLPKSAENAIVTVKNSNLTGLNVVNIAAPSVNVTVDKCTITCNDQTDIEGYDAIAVNKDAVAAKVTVTNTTIVLMDDDSVEASNQAKDAELTVNGTVIQQKDVAYISYGDTYYSFETLNKAIAKANADETIVLMRDVTTSEIVTIDKSVTIDGAGHTLTYTGSGASARAINVAYNESAKVNLTIKNLTVDCTSSYCQRGINYNDDGALTLEGVTVTGKNVTYALNLPGSSDNATVAITNSSLTGNIALNVWGENSKIKVTNTALVSVDNSTAEGYAAVVLNNDGTSVANGTLVEIKGGSITAKDEKGNLATAVRNATSTGNVVVSESTTVTGLYTRPVAIVDYGTDQFYSCNTLQAAINKAIEGNAKVKLIANVEEDEIITIAGKVTIDGNGFELKSTAKRAINIDTTEEVTITNLTITGGKGCERGINIINKAGKTNLDQVKISGVSHYGAHIATSAGSATLNIKNSDLTGYGALAVYGAGSTVNVENSNLTGVNNYKGESNAFATIAYGATDATITVTGGTVTAKSNEDCEKQSILCHQTNAVCTGTKVTLDTELVLVDGNTGYFFIPTTKSTVAVRAEYADELLAEGYVTSEADTNGMCTVIGSAVAKVGDKTYPTVEAALAAAVSGNTVVLLKDVTTTGVLAVKKGITLDLNGFVLTAEAMVAFNGAQVADNSTDKTGILKVNPEMLALSDDNAQLPIWNGANGEFVFATMDFSRVMFRNVTNDKFEFVFQPLFGKGEFNKLFANGGKDNGVTIVAELSWMQSGKPCTQRFVYSDVNVSNVYNLNHVFTLTCSGMVKAGLTGKVTANILIETDTGVTVRYDNLKP